MMEQHDFLTPVCAASLIRIPLSVRNGPPQAAVPCPAEPPEARFAEPGLARNRQIARQLPRWVRKCDHLNNSRGFVAYARHRFEGRTQLVEVAGQILSRSATHSVIGGAGAIEPIRNPEWCRGLLPPLNLQSVIQDMNARIRRRS